MNTRSYILSARAQYQAIEMGDGGDPVLLQDAANRISAIRIGPIDTHTKVLLKNFP